METTDSPSTWRQPLLTPVEADQLTAIVRTYGLVETIRSIAYGCASHAVNGMVGGQEKLAWWSDAKLLRRITDPQNEDSLINGRDKQP